MFQSKARASVIARPRPSLARTSVIARPRQSLARRIWKAKGWYLFVIPPFVLLVLFTIYPTLMTFWQSMFAPSGRDQVFVGGDQFASLAKNSVFWNSIANTALLGFCFLIIVIPLAVVVASMLNRVRRGSTPLKVIFFLPQLTSAVAVAIIFNYVFQPDWGLLNGSLRAIGIQDTPLWLSDPRFGLFGSRAAVTILAVWTGLGYFILIVLSGLQSINPEMYEAAQIDGAGPLRTWWYITIPSLRPTLIFLMITGTLDALARFSDLWTLGGPGGAPARSLQTVVMFMYQAAFESGNANRAAAVGVIFFIIAMAVTLISYRGLLTRRGGNK